MAGVLFSFIDSRPLVVRCLLSLALYFSVISAFGERAIINVGNFPNDRIGDSARVAWTKANANFAELYNRVGSNVVSFSDVLVSVKASPYSATGNGTTDDTSAISSAITAAPTGSQIYFPPGTYRITSGLGLSKPLKVVGNGAKILLSGSTATTVFSCTSSNICISGMEFSTDRNVTTPISAIVATSTGVDGVRVENNSFHRMRIRFQDSNATDNNPQNYAIWIRGNSFDGDYVGATGGDTANVMDVRDYKGVFIQDNYLTVANEERWAHISGAQDVLVSGNTFESSAQTLGGSIFDTFADCKRVVFGYNTVRVRNSSYGVAVQAKPTSSMFSEHTDYVVSHNVFDIESDAAYANVIGLFGSWSLSDATLRSSQAIVDNNQITLTAPNSSDPPLVVRGFTSASVHDNKVFRPETRSYTTAVDVSNNEDSDVSRNYLEYGYILVSGAASNPSGSSYRRAPKTVRVSGNTIRGFNNLGGVALLNLTNAESVIVQANHIKSSANSGAFGGIYISAGGTITNVIVADNTFDGDCPELTVDTTSVVRLVEENNSWQAPSVLVDVKDLTQTSTNIVVDMADKHGMFNLTCNTNVYISVTNCPVGRKKRLWIRAGTADRTISFASSLVVRDGYPTIISSNHTAWVDFWSKSTDCDNANTIAEPFIQNTEDYPQQFRNAKFNKVITDTYVQFPDSTIQSTAPIPHVKATSSDTTPGYLTSKLVAGANVTISTNNAGGNETLTIASTGGGGGGGTNYTFQSPLSQSGTNVSVSANGISNSLLRQSAGTSVIGRSAGTTGNVADISADTDDTVLWRKSGALSFAPIPTNINSLVLVGTSTFTASSGDFTTGDSYADVVFGSDTMQTDVLPAGSYLIVATAQFNQYRQAGQQLYLKLYNTETSATITGTERFSGPQVSSSFYADWPVTTQARVTITSAGRIKVQAKNGVSGDATSFIRKDNSSIWWIRDTSTVDSINAGTVYATNWVSESFTLGGVARTNWPSFAEVGWGAIAGTLTDQTDLVGALAARQPLDGDLTSLAGGITGLVKGAGNGSGYGAAVASDINTALGFAPQPASANLTNWSAIATSAKQAADTDLDSVAAGITGLVKGGGNGSGYSAAVAGTDYQAAFTAGHGITNSAGTLKLAIAAGSNISFATNSTTITITAAATVADDTAFSSAWNGVTATSPSENAIYDWAHTFDTDDDGKVNVLDMGAGLVKTDSSGVVSAAASGTDYAPATSGSSILKGNGSGGFSSAASGTDYAPATSGSSILKGNGSGGFSNASSGTDYAPATATTSVLKGNGSGGFSAAASADVQTAIGSGVYRYLNESALNISSSAIDLSLTNRVFSKSLSADTTFTFSNLSDGQWWSVILTNGASWTVTWPTVTWIGGSAPVMDTGTGTVNIFSFTRQNGVTFGDVSQKSSATLATIAALSNSAGVLTNDGSGNLSWGAGGGGASSFDSTNLLLTVGTVSSVSFNTTDLILTLTY